MAKSNSNDRSQPPANRERRPRAGQGAQGAPNARPRERGSRAGDPDADSIMPGREFGAGGQIDDGPDATAGAGRRG